MSTPRYRMLDQVTTAHNTVVVEQRGRRIDLAVAGATFATWHPTDYLTGYSWDAITAGCLCRAGGPPQRLLLLGLAGGTVARQLRMLLPDLAIEAVEIDPGLVDLGNRYLHLDETGVTIHSGDAYQFLAGAGAPYDVIADDVYLTGFDDVERPQLPGPRWIERLQARLAPGGVAVANFVTGDHHDRIYRDAKALFKAAFPAVATIAPPRGYNRILVGGDALASLRQVRAAGAAFPRARDRETWSRLRLRRR